jgi:hypothetical protein
VARTGVTAVEESTALLKLPHTAGPDRIATLKRLATLASTTHAALRHVDLGAFRRPLRPAGPTAGQVLDGAESGADHSGPDRR